MPVKGKKGPRPKAAKAKPKKGKKLDPDKDFNEPVRRPRQQQLAGMEDNKIKILEELALDYATIRDERQRLSVREIELKKKLLDLMKANKKQVYQRDGIKITLEVEKETVKVRVRKPSETDNEDGEGEEFTGSDPEAEPEAAEG